MMALNARYASIEAAAEVGVWTRRDRRPLHGLPARNAVVEFAGAPHDSGDGR